MEKSACPIWGTSAQVRPTERDGYRVDSARAGGRYFITGTAEVNLRGADDSLKTRVTTWLVDQRGLGVRWPEINSGIVDEAGLRPALSVHQRADRLLQYFLKETSFLGEKIAFDHEEAEFMVIRAWSESMLTDEVEYLLNVLAHRGFIALEHVGDTSASVQISVDGYVRLAELEEKHVTSKQGFIAMWFDPSMDNAYEHGMAPGIRDAGYEAVRIDRREHNNRIDDAIVAEIRRSRFVVADFTQDDKSGARGGVYYEAGFAHGLNIPVIFTCQADAIGKVHFDTRQYNHITWKTPEELRARLAQRISATLGDGPLKRSG